MTTPPAMDETKEKVLQHLQRIKQGASRYSEIDQDRQASRGQCHRRPYHGRKTNLRELWRRYVRCHPRRGEERINAAAT